MSGTLSNFSKTSGARAPLEPPLTEALYLPNLQETLHPSCKNPNDAPGSYKYQNDNHFSYSMSANPFQIF